MMYASHYRLFSKRAYLNELTDLVKTSKHRVLITAMITLYDEATGPIFDALFDALERGVEVTLVFDEFTKSPFGPGLKHYYTGNGRQQLRETFKICDALKARGASVTFVRPLGLNHFRGRDHVKAIVIDDTWYCFGGINFSAHSFANHDYMLSRQSEKQATMIFQTILKLRDTTPTADYSLSFDSDSELLLDVGIAKSSIIYNTACELAIQAEKAIYVSQLSPDSRLAAALYQINTQYYFNRPSQYDFPANIAGLVDAAQFKGENSYHGTTYIHAKYILYTLRDGSHMVLSGSHNFHSRGVQYGTQEIALLSRNEALWNMLHNFTLKTLR